MNEDKNKNDILEEFLSQSKIINNETNNHIYNIKYSKKPFILQFEQLINYYNFKKQFEKILITGEISNDFEKTENNIKSQIVQKKIITQNNYCLIDKNWIEKWKKHVGYDHIIKYCNDNKINRYLNDDDNDYKWISKIIENNYIKNCLTPLDMSSFYKNNELDILSDFEVVNQNSYKLFIAGSKETHENLNYTKYSIHSFKGKIIIFLNEKIFWIIFKRNKDKEKQKYYEIIKEDKEEEKEKEINENKINENKEDKKE